MSENPFAVVPQSKIELMETATQRLVNDISMLQQKLSNFTSNSFSQNANLLVIDNQINEVLQELTVMKNSYYPVDNESPISQVEYLRSELERIQSISNQLKSLLSKGVSKESNKIEKSQKTLFESKIQRIQRRINGFSDTISRMHGFIKHDFNTGKQSDLKIVQKVAVAVKNSPLQSFLKNAKNSGENSEIIDNYLSIKDKLNEKKAKMDEIQQNIVDLKDIIYSSKRIKESGEELDYINKTVDRLNSAPDAEHQSLRTQFRRLESSFKTLKTLFDDTISKDESFLPLIKQSALQICETGSKLYQSALNEKKIIDGLGTRKYLDEQYAQHARILRDMETTVNNLLDKQNNIERELSTIQPLSYKSLQEIIIGLSDMHNMTKFTEHVGGRMKQMEISQKKEMEKLSQVEALNGNNEREIAKLNSLVAASSSASDQNRSIQNEIIKLRDSVEKKYQKVSKFSDSHSHVFSLISDYNKRIDSLETRLGELVVRNRQPVDEALELNERLESIALQNSNALKNEIISVSRSIKHRFEDIDEKVTKLIKQCRKTAAELKVKQVGSKEKAKHLNNVIAKAENEIKKKEENVASQDKLAKVKTAITNFEKNGTNAIKAVKTEINKMLTKDFSPVNGGFVEEIVDRVNALGDTADVLVEYADDLSSGPIGNLKQSYTSVRTHVNNLIAGKEALNVDMDESNETLWQLPAFRWTDQPRLAYYSGMIGAKDPRASRKGIQQLIKETKEISRKADLATRIKGRVMRDKEMQVTMIGKLDAIKCKNAEIGDNQVPLVAHRINRLSQKLDKK